MSGSIKDMVYTSDGGQLYIVRLDESNGESTGFADFTGTTAGAVEAPKSLKMRYANTFDPLTGAKRKFPIGTPTDYGLLSVPGAVITSPSGEFQVTSLRGEKKRVPSAADTGLVDGDET